MTQEQEQEVEVVSGEVLASAETISVEEEIAEELAEVEAPVADVLARIVGDEFGLEVITPWGERWIWVGVGAETTQEIYKMLGDPVVYRQPEEA